MSFYSCRLLTGTCNGRISIHLGYLPSTSYGCLSIHVGYLHLHVKDSLVFMYIGYLQGQVMDVFVSI